MQWASAIATPSRLEDATAEAAENVLAQLGQQPDLVMVFVSSAHSNHYGELPASMRACFPRATNFGCCAQGVIGSERELEGQDALVMMAAVLPGVTIHSFHLDGDAETWPGQVGVDPDQDPEFIVLTDPMSCDPSVLLPWLDAAYPESTKIGGIASGCQTAGECVLLQGDTLHRTGAIGLALVGDVEIDTIVAQGCKPVGNPMFITRASGSVLYELDGKPAVPTLERLIGSLDADDRSLARHSLFIGMGMHESREVYEHGDFLIRSILGLDPAAQAIAIAGEVREGSIAQFHLRDAHTSTTDLQELLSKHQYGKPAGALLFSCLGRGQGLYGEADHDTKLFHDQMGDVPMGGFFGNGEIGPVQGQTFLHSYTSAFGLIRSKHG